MVVAFINYNYKAHYNVGQLLEAPLKQLAHHRLTSDSIESLQTDKDQRRRPSPNKLRAIGD